MISIIHLITCGTPAVAFDCPGGIREIMKEGVSGFLAQAGDVGG